MVQDFLDKGITPNEIRDMIRFRDGDVTCGIGVVSFLEQERGYIRLNALGDDCLPKVEINGNEMTATEAYCYERYYQYKKKVCNNLGVPYYVQLDLEWILADCFHIATTDKDKIG